MHLHELLNVPLHTVCAQPPQSPTETFRLTPVALELVGQAIRKKEPWIVHQPFEDGSLSLIGHGTHISIFMDCRQRYIGSDPYNHPNQPGFYPGFVTPLGPKEIAALHADANSDRNMTALSITMMKAKVSDQEELHFPLLDELTRIAKAHVNLADCIKQFETGAAEHVSPSRDAVAGSRQFATAIAHVG